MPVYLNPPPGSPLTRAVAAIVGILVLAGALMLGIFAFVIALGVSLVAGIWLWFRSWRFGKAQASGSSMGDSGHPDHSRDSGRNRDNNALEGEYTVVSRDQDRQP